jgi:hypothetical protein
MNTCFGKKNKQRKEIKTTEVFEKEDQLHQKFDGSDDTEVDLDTEVEWIASQYLSGDYQLDTNGKLKINKFKILRKCIYCKYIEYHVSFLPLCTSAENYKKLVDLVSLRKVVVFNLDDSTYYHVECGPNWLCEIDLLYVPFVSSTKYDFLLLPKTSDAYEFNHFYCDCSHEKRMDPTRWEYYRACEQ